MTGDSGGDKFYHLEYFHFMINQLNDTIRYSDSKHTLGMTLVVSILFASNEFIFSKLDVSVYEVRLILNINVASALLAIGFGYMGIFPKFVAPSFTRRRRSGKPNIFYFREIDRYHVDGLRQAIDEAFPNSELSRRYRDDAVNEIHALSRVASQKFAMLRLFLYALFFFLVTLGWLFVSTLLDLSAGRS